LEIFVGIDWAEAHHDICVLDERGTVLAKRRIAEGLEGVGQLHQLLADHATEPNGVVIGIETDRGLLVGALLAAGYRVYAINPLAASRYRDRHSTSGAKSDPGDAKVLADLVRTDQHNHRPVAGDSELAVSLQVLARAHQNLIWSRQRLVNQLRNNLREYYPAALDAFGTELAHPIALGVLDAAPAPAIGRTLSRAKLTAILRRAGRERGVEEKVVAIQAQLRAPHLAAPTLVGAAYGKSVASTVRILRDMNAELASLEAELSSSFEKHPDAEIYRSLPGLGIVLGARVLSEFGDDRTRFAHPKSRKNYAGSSPITKASGTRRVVLARMARNRRLAAACHQWAFSALKSSVGAHHYYRALRQRGKTHHQALRALANRLVGILHGCLDHRQPYREGIAWPNSLSLAA
jgi:transposase